MKRRIFSFCVCFLVLICTLVPSVYAASSYTINGVSVRNDDFSSSKGECWAYAQNVYKKIWGTSFSNHFSCEGNMLRNLSDDELTLTVEHLKEYVSAAAVGSVIRITNTTYLRADKDGNIGHSQVIVQKDSEGFTVFQGGLSAEPHRNEKYYTWSQYISSWYDSKHCYIKYIQWPGTHNYQPNDPVTHMTSGAGATVPDGNYIIASAANTSLYLDIAGGATSAEALTTVQLAENDNPPDVDIWTIRYIGEGGFYTIKQLTGNAYLDVIDPDSGDGANVQVWDKVEYDDEKWSISRGNNGVVRLQSKANSLYATVDGALEGGTNVVVKYASGSNCQEWFLIPYPKTIPSGAGQTIPDGNYMISYAAEPRYYLDIDGSDVPAEAFNNVKLWYNDGEKDINSYDVWTVHYVGEGGFYTIKQLNGEAYLDVLSPSNAVCQNVQIWDNPNSDYDEKWSIILNGSSYRIQSKASGMYLTVDGNVDAGDNIIVHTASNYYGQDWLFIPWPSTYTISYNANGGTGAPGSQTKTYGQTLTLSSTKPTRANSSAGSYKVTFNANGGSVSPSSMEAARTTSYTFNNWKDGNGNTYNAGGSYTANANATLTAQWNSSTKTAAVTLPTPTRDGYTFKGWAESSSAASGVTGSYTPSGNVTLYAVWQRENYYLDINGWLDGQSYSHIEGYGTADMYINGTLAGQVKTDFYKAFPSGTTYEIKNIRPTEGHAYYGIKSGSRTGTISNNTSIQLDFRTCPTSISETPDTLVFNGHTYCLYSTPMTWYDAKTLCEALGGHLATITSAEEDQAVAGLLHGDINAWLGATDIDREGEWHWITGESFSYTNWMTGQPDNGSSNPEGAENYLQYRDEGCKWNDNPGCWAHSFICEFDTAWYTVAYNANGGTGAPDSQTKTHGTALTLSSGIPTRDGYTFSGWATNADAVTAAYQPSDQYTGDANIMLYAVWSPFSMDVSKTIFDFGEPIMVTADSAKTKAWVGLFKRGESTDSTKWICWYYVREHRNTPCDVTAWPENNPRADRLLPGEYTLALYSDDAGDILKSIDISVKMSEPDFKLPPSLKEIESEAFEGGAFIYVSVPSGVTKIGARAFADCPKLQHIEILGPDTWIDPTSFAGVSELTIHGADGSYAEFYASKYGFNFIAE